MEFSAIQANYKNYKNLSTEDLTDTINALIEIVYSGRGELHYREMCERALNTLTNYRLTQGVNELSTDATNKLIKAIG